MQKAQVFSLETNSSVRNRLTHSLEVADIGKTLVQKIGSKLIDKKLADIDDIRCMETIVEKNGCSLVIKRLLLKRMRIRRIDEINIGIF